ncbi:MULTISPECIES: hypothetical protein [Rufibacter]|uniref:Uncharacterized protein n=1 Tax=Rufibacter quisquiliarum TaxID=1549639 RepID=A0A839G8W5_9BACT|nr:MULTISPECIES: hypothetical protein [Rufibacter]MBA9075894.1 hypothetical protein [Rufibacter quisquiliarum]
MPYKSDNSSHQGSENKGAPSNRGISKAGVKSPGDPDEIQRAEDLVAKHLDDQERPVPEARTHPNRNTDKQDIDKPSYGGS